MEHLCQSKRCLAQREMFQNGVYPAWHPNNAMGATEAIIPEEDKQEFESTYLIYSQPNLLKCLDVPNFCKDMQWKKKNFRQLCQDVDASGNKGPIYDCTLATKYQDYIRWRNNLCCSDEELLSVGACNGNFTCNNTDGVKERIRLKHIDVYIANGGYTPQGFRPAGNFLMDAQKQEDIQNSAPFDLFYEDSQGINNEKSNVPWLRAEGCCRCSGHPLPAVFNSIMTNKGFPDTKHQEVQMTISAIQAVNLTVVAELMHGSYYIAFDDHFGSHNVTDLHVHTPHRADFNPHDASASQRSTWLAIIEKDDFRSTELPLNLPHKRDALSGKREFESVILVDHTFASHSKLLKNDSNYDDDGIVSEAPNSQRESTENMKVSETWWEDGDKTKSTGSSGKLIALFLKTC